MREIGETITAWDGLRERLGLAAVPASWSEGWARSALTMPAEAPRFVTEKGLREMDLVLRFPAEAFAGLNEAARLVRGNKDLLRLMWHCHHMMFLDNADPGFDPTTGYVPDLQFVMGNFAPMFTAMIVLSGFHRTAQAYEAAGIPSTVLEETMSQIPALMRAYFNSTGFWGLGHLWPCYHTSFRLFKLGRLQFCLNRFKGNMRVFRHLGTGEVVILAETGIRFRQDGLIDGTNRIFDREQTWLSRLDAGDTVISGHPISAAGVAAKDETTLRADEWEAVLRNGDPVLDIHIPDGGRMDDAECGRSLRAAGPFFGRYFPDFDYKAYVCSSWLLFPPFKEMLEPSANIVRFQERFRLYPVPGDGQHNAARIFGGRLEDLSQVPQLTSLQRKVKAYLESGHLLCDFGGFILKDKMLW